MIGRFLLLALVIAGLSQAKAFGAEPEATPGEWKFVSNKDGVALYRRQRAITNESKAIGDIAASTDLVHAVIANKADRTPTVTAIRLRRPNRPIGSSLHRHGPIPAV